MSDTPHAPVGAAPTAPASSGATMRSLTALLIVVLVAMTGFGLFIPIFPFLGLETNAGPAEITIAMGAYSFGQLIAAPAWGRLSDRIGRKPVLVLGLLGACASYFVIAYAETVLQMGLARLFGGLMAGNIGAAFAAAADLADDRTRARNMGMLAAAFGVGFIIGPAVGAFAVGDDPAWADYRRVCMYAAIFAAFAALMAAVLFRETRRQAAREASSAQQRVRRSELLRSRPLLLTFVVVTLLTLTAQAMLETTASLWADARLGWGVREMGITFASVGVITALLQGGGAGPLNRRFGERQVLLTGLAVVCVGFVGVAIARDVTMAIAALVVIAIGTGLSGPALQSLLAAQATEEDRGVVMGLGQSASAMGRVVGPLIGGPLMAAYGASAPFVAGAAILGVAIAVLFIRPARAP